MELTISREWEIRDRHGVVVQRVPEKECNSYIVAFLDLLYTHFSGNTVTITDGGNVARAGVAASAGNFRATAPAGTTSYGLFFGTGTAAVALGDIYAGSLITQGTGAGQLDYAAQSLQALATTGGVRRFRLIRTATNASGSTITVNETGIGCQASGYTFGIERSLESPGVAIADGQGGTLTYTISITV